MSFRTWLREPLLHFVLLGGLIFAVDHVIAARKPNAQVIAITPEIEKEARELFRSAQGREPTPAEMTILRDRWLDNEVLYREGLAMRLDAGDPTVRERVIFKALNVIQSNITVPTVDENTLRVWFEKHRDKYDQPARIDFLEAVPQGGTTPEAARQFAVALNTGARNDTKSSVRIFKGRPLNTIVLSFGDEFARALEKLPPGEWHTLPSKDGERIVQVQKREDRQAVDYADVQGNVQRDWREAQEQELLGMAIKNLEKKYIVHRADETL